MTIIDKLARENPNVEALQVRMAFSLAAFAQTLAQLNSWKETQRHGAKHSSSGTVTWRPSFFGPLQLAAGEDSGYRHPAPAVLAALTLMAQRLKLWI